MGFAVLHIEKGTKGKAGGLGSHIDRTKNVPNADQSLSHRNISIIPDADGSPKFIHSWNWKEKESKLSLQERIDKRIEEGYTGKTTIRKDAVTHLNIVLTGSHEDMENKIYTKHNFFDWLKDNYHFACKQWGQANIIEFTVHLDERTPHIHCVIVPLTTDGRLSAKEIMGNREKMSNLQELYGQAMSKYDLSRGVKGSTATHDSVREFYGRVDEAMNSTEEVQDNKIKQAQLIMEAMRTRKENAQLKGEVKQQAKELDKLQHPEKYQQEQKFGHKF